MGSAYHDGILLFFGNFGNHDAWRWQDGTLKWRRVTAVSARAGNVVWSRALNYRTRPLIVGDKLIIEPRACELRTGKIVMRSHPVTGAQVPWEFLRPGHTCAVTSASADMLFYRSSATAIYDLTGDRGLTLFGAIRPGCLINMIPANGLLLMPEASSGCTCSFPLRCSVVWKPKHNRSQPWSVFITHGAMTPARHFAINLGAPADMKDSDGTVWFGYPNPKTEYWQNHFPDYGVKFDLHDDHIKGMGYFRRDFKDVAIEGTREPWLFTSGCLGLSKCEVPLIDDLIGQQPGVYTVRLGFSAPPSDRVGQRVFDIVLQGDPVAENFDILEQAGAPEQAVIKEFKGIQVDNSLTVELVPKVANPKMEQAPMINFIEVDREDVENIPGPSKTLRPISRMQAQQLLRSARQEIEKGNFEGALAKLHRVLDGCASPAMKREALQPMALMANPGSLGWLAKYFKGVAPVLWGYKPPEPEVANYAAAAYVAIAEKTAKADRQKGIRMLEYSLKVADDNLAKQVTIKLKSLGVSVEGDGAH